MNSTRPAISGRPLRERLTCLLELEAGLIATGRSIWMDRERFPGNMSRVSP